ncbi:glycine--tRNA ligase [Candidatus Haliotispira prima]|uniref:Glycine--tRNA ligase n=1 Tax=Candidatus Haliotispira prima TaxID=3034016 RepID=A0ABY8MIF1_9SPIO|nr:glycine--tRNA ligase [Candidatus Haliotispira prima]
MAKKKTDNAHKATNQHGAGMDKIVALCKRRGFVYPSSEIYGGLSATWDYGPLGVELKRNIQNLWWREMTRRHDNIVGLDAAILMHPRTWEASGHVDNFSDPLIDCKDCKARYRADHLEPEIVASRKCPACGGEMTQPRNFNLMFTTTLGAMETSGMQLYLRPETAQGIFVNFKNVVDTNRVSIPFGIAQVGKAFRNEITTRNFIFRTCEFEQMEMQYFVKPGTEDEFFAYWKEERLRWYVEQLGIERDNLRTEPHGPDALAHYAKEACDIEYRYPHGWEEMEGIHSRTDYDLSRHGEFCGKEIQYLDPQTQERYVPYVVETSSGLTRAVLVTLLDAYREQPLENGDVRTVLRFHPNVAPYRVAVLPLMKKDGLVEIATELKRDLEEDYNVFYDQQGSIGKRYRRMDEIGTPFCITVDPQTKTDNSVTLRLRDSMEQRRIPLSEVADAIRLESRNYQARA